MDLYTVHSQCISKAQPGVKALCAPLHAAMAPCDESQYKYLLEQLNITHKDFRIPQQRLLHHLLEKHLLVQTTIPGWGLQVD